jgi:phage baseplate assembly protein W
MANSEVSLSLPFSLDKLGNISVTTDQNTIWADRVKIAVGTSLGERVMRPEYGTSIAAAVFNTGSFMENTVHKEIERIFNDSLPLLALNDVSFEYSEPTNTLMVTVVYELPNKIETTTQIGVVVVSTSNTPYEELS